MMRKIILILLILSSFLAINAQEKSDKEKNGLFGYVKAIKDEKTILTINNGKPIEKERLIHFTQTYNLEGKYKTSYEYSYGKLFEGNSYFYNLDNRLIEIKSEVRYEDFTPVKKQFDYFESGLLKEERGYKKDGKIVGKKVFTYNSFNELVQMQSFELVKDFNFDYSNHIEKYKYDEKHRLLEKITYNNVKGILKPTDTVGKLYYGYSRQVFYYDDKDRIIVINQFIEENKLKSTVIYQYDEKGNLKEEIDYFADGNLDTKKKFDYYDFDLNENWTKKTEFECVTQDGKSFYQPTETIYRQIEYFSEKEIKEFEAKNPPSKAQETKVLQNTDSEEYAVYLAIFKEWLENKSVKNIVVDRFSSARSFGNDSQLTINSFLTPKGQNSPLQQSMVDDYNAKNTRKSSQLLENLFGNNNKIILVNNSEIREIFSEGCNEGWNKFYQKYPNSQGITTLSRVGFNKEKTKAIVYFGTQSHCLAGAGFLMILQKETTTWKILKQQMLWIS